VIWLFLGNYWAQLSRDRAAQILSFVVPLMFFSVFALVFGGGRRIDGTSRLKVAVVDESRSDRSRALVSALEADSSLRVRTVVPPTGPGEPGAPLTRETAEQQVRRGDVDVALVLPAGVEWSIMSFAPGERVKALLIHDPGDPVAVRVMGGLLQRAAMRAHAAASGERPEAGFEEMLPLPFEDRAVMGLQRTSPMIAFYAAGIAVMFIMFAAAAGGGGALIEENESGTLERVLTSGLGMTGLLLAKWLSITSMCAAQIVVMFVWGALVFGLPLASHLAGFVIMTVFTAGAAAAFGLVIGTLARTRQQLSGLANLLILGLNALGGSMFPRFLMSDAMQQVSLVGFNAWALDGYLKVFWREAPLASLAPQVAALIGFTVLFLLLARRFARRWETA
jgi:ABC-2 type transport system permease protein